MFSHIDNSTQLRTFGTRKGSHKPQNNHQVTTDKIPTQILKKEIIAPMTVNTVRFLLNQWNI